MSSPSFDGRGASEAFDDFSYEEFLNGKCFRPSHLPSQTADIVVGDYPADDLAEDSASGQSYHDRPASVASEATLYNTAEAQMAPRPTVEEEAGNTSFTAQQVVPSVARKGRPAAPLEVKSSTLPHFSHGTSTSPYSEVNHNPFSLPAVPTSHMSSFGNQSMTESSAYQGNSAYGHRQPNGYSLMNSSLAPPPGYTPLTRAVHYGMNPTSGYSNFTPLFGQVTQLMLPLTQSLDNVLNHLTSNPSQSGLLGNSTS